MLPFYGIEVVGLKSVITRHYRRNGAGNGKTFPGSHLNSKLSNSAVETKRYKSFTPRFNKWKYDNLSS